VWWTEGLGYAINEAHLKTIARDAAPFADNRIGLLEGSGQKKWWRIQGYINYLRGSGKDR